MTAPPTHRAPDADAGNGDGAGDGSGDGALRWVGRILAWVVILACLGVLAIAVAVPRLGGATPYTILTGSMAPGMPPGTLVVVRPTETTDVAIGDVITFQLRSGEPTVVTHRVVDIQTNLRGQTTFQTQGDANSVVDEDWVRPEQIRGERWYSVPHLGRVNTLLNGTDRQLLVYAAAGAMVLYAGAMFAGAARDRARNRRSS